MFTYINPDVRRKLIERKKLVRIDDDGRLLGLLDVQDLLDLKIG